MAAKWQIDVKFLEQGDIYFFYKPRRGIEKTSGIGDVARFFFVLDPEGEPPPRYIVMGNKKMPLVTDGNESTWGFVQMVGGRGFETYRQDVKPKKDASRPAGEGIYTIVSHRDHVHLLFSLELPKMPGEVQRAFNLEKQGNYIFLNRPIENPPKSPDVPFSNFSPASPQLLNQRGTEVLLIGVGADVGRLGVRANTDPETLDSADIISELKLDSSRHPVDSLISGDWV